MFDVQKSSSITDIIAAGKALDLSHSKLHFKSAVTIGDRKLVINYQSVLDKYHDLLVKHITVVTLSDKEYEKYKFQPKLMCFELYGTTELWSSILRINNIMSVTQFTLQTLNLFTQDIFGVINEIFILEDKALKSNNYNIYT